MQIWISENVSGFLFFKISRKMPPIYLKTAPNFYRGGVVYKWLVTCLVLLGFAIGLTLDTGCTPSVQQRSVMSTSTGNVRIPAPPVRDSIRVWKNMLCNITQSVCHLCNWFHLLSFCEDLHKKSKHPDLSGNLLMFHRLRSLIIIMIIFLHRTHILIITFLPH